MTNSIVPSIVKSYKGRAIRINPDNQYVCITDMASANGKLYGHWRELKGTQEYLDKFSSVIGIPITELLQVIQGGNPDLQGTWAHPKIAIRFAQWCNTEFAIQVDFWIDELLTTGMVELVPSVPQLLPSEIAVKTSEDIVKIQSNLGATSPRLAQILIDFAMNNVVESKQLPSAEFPEDRWYGLVQIADKMGIKTNLSSRVKLGQYFTKLIKSGGIDIERVQEERLCNGQFEPIWCYRDDEKTRSIIQQWANSNLTIA
jgi:hypothetical protein